MTATPKALASRVGDDIVQLILFEATDTANILWSFDMLPCRVALEKVECTEHLSMHETDWGGGGHMHRELDVSPTFICSCGQVIQHG